MLKSVIDDYLSSISEIQFYLPFRNLLAVMGYSDIHQIHGSYEFGKDIVAKREVNGVLTQFFFVVKAGDINAQSFNGQVKTQLLQSLTNPLSHPNYDSSQETRIIFVLTGALKPPANIEFQTFNDFVRTTLNKPAVECWEKTNLISFFIQSGVEPFYDLHRSAELISRFYSFYGKIKNHEEIDSFAIEEYSRHWLSYDYAHNLNRLQVCFEAYLFASMFQLNNRPYEAMLVLSGYARVLIKNNEGDKTKEALHAYCADIFHSIVGYLEKLFSEGKGIIEIHRTIFDIFLYPTHCLKIMELLSLGILLGYDGDNQGARLLEKILSGEKGCYRPISDNYAISIALTALALVKINNISALKRFITNTTVWCCDRYERVGVSAIGSSERQEIEQLLSEHLDGFAFQKRKTSFIASVLLFFSSTTPEDDLYKDVANDLSAAQIIPEFYHVTSDDSLLGYERVKVAPEPVFSFVKTKNIASWLAHEFSDNKITNRDKLLFLIMFLMRDRFFPAFCFELQ